MRTGAPLLLLCLACCTGRFLRSAAECPSGYVPVDRGDGHLGRALSADGVVIAVRESANDAEGTAEFWTAVVAKELTRARGYALRESRDVAPDGKALLFAAPMEGAPVYYVAIFVTPRRIRILEAAGPADAVQRDLPMLEEFARKSGIAGL